MRSIVLSLAAGLSMTAYAAPGACAGTDGGGITFGQFLQSLLLSGSSNKVGSGTARLFAVPPDAPEKIIALAGAGHLEHLGKLILDPSRGGPKPICLILVVEESDPIRKEKRSYDFRMNLDGVLEKALLVIAKLDENGAVVPGSSVVQDKAIDPAELEERVNYELDFWLKGKHRRTEEAATGEGIAFGQLVRRLLDAGSSKTVSPGTARIFNLSPDAPEKTSALVGDDHLEHVSQLILDPALAEPKPACVILVSAERDLAKKERRSYRFRMSLDGGLEKALYTIAKLDENGVTVPGSGVVQDKVLDPAELKERVEYELDFWLKGKHRKPEDAAAGGGTLEAPKLPSATFQAVKEAAEKMPEEASELALASDVDTPSYGKAENPYNYAVVAGVEKHAGLPEARFAERDAEAVHAHLRAMGYLEGNIRFLSGKEATRAGLVEGLETWLPLGVTKNSTVFFYYAGHGAPDPKSGQASLLPADGDPERLEDTGYPLKRLYQKLNALKAKQVIVALDACFSGLGGRSVPAQGARPAAAKADAGPGRFGRVIAFSASGNGQIAGAIEEQQHGAFTYYFLKGLNGDAAVKDGTVTVKSLYDYLAPKVAEAARRTSREQRPQLLPSPLGARGELVLR